LAQEPEDGNELSRCTDRCWLLQIVRIEDSDQAEKSFAGIMQNFA